MQTQTAMRDFLAAVIPASGVKFLATLGNGKWVHRAHADLSEMASAAELSSRGVDVYHACASFELPEYTSAKGKKRSRTAANAVATRCFWLDIDVGDDKSYRDQRAAISALSDFCNVHGLPKPMLVSSGYGLHCYWLMTDDVPKADWLPVACKLKALTKHPSHPLLVDQSRTSDISSLLRPVGSRNFKRGGEGVPVELLKAVDPIDFEVFRASVDSAYLAIAATIVRPDVKPRTSGHMQADMGEVEDALHHIDPDAGGRDDWWRVIAILADEFGEAGRDPARHWSRGDFGKQPAALYDEPDFDVQFDHCLDRHDDYDGDRATIGTLFWLAKHGGWKRRPKGPEWVSDLNERYAWIEQQSAIYRFQFSDFVKPADFRQQHANYYVEVSGGEQAKSVPAGDAWLKHRARREHHAIVMRPSEPQVTSDNCLNVWHGFSVEPNSGDAGPFFELFNRLIPDANAAQYVLQWLAHLVQHPGVKKNVALVIWSRQEGVGKNLLFECFSSIIGKRHAAVIGQADLSRDFNGWARDKIFVLGDEVLGADRREGADKLKGLITGTTIQINEKHQPPVEMDNLANFVFISNHSTAVFVGDDDRRYFVWEIEAGPLPPEKATAFAKWRDIGGLASLLEHMLQLDLAGFDAKARAPATAAKTIMVDANRSDLEIWAEQIMASGARATLGRELMTATELADLYADDSSRPKPSAKTVSATFRKLGAYLKTHQIRVNGLKVRPLAIDRPDHWRVQLDGSWAAEMAKPILRLTSLSLPHLYLRSEDADDIDLNAFSHIGAEQPEKVLLQ